MSDDIALSTHELTKSFGKLEIIRGVDLLVRRGERHALIGPNGAGKSTMFGLLSGGIRSSSGKIVVLGEDMSNADPVAVNRKGVARSFQVSRLFPRLSVFENIRVALHAQRTPIWKMFRPTSSAAAINERAEELVALVRLGNRIRTLAGSLSYSEQRALELALTLAMDPAIILLDEPTAGMSRHETEGTIELIENVSRGRTLLIVEHDMEVVFKVCDRISVLVYGQLIASDTPQAVRSNAKVQEAYLGEQHAAH